MFDNIGGKIKSVAVCTCVVGMIASVIWGIVLFFSSFLSGLLVIVVGCACSWVGTCTLYGFGELIEETRRNREINQQLLAALRPQQPAVQPESAKRAASIGSYSIPGAKEAAKPTPTGWTCKFCGAQNRASATSCFKCGESPNETTQTDGWACRFCGTKNSSKAMFCRNCRKFYK